MGLILVLFLAVWFYWALKKMRADRKSGRCAGCCGGGCSHCSSERPNP